MYNIIPLIIILVCLAIIIAIILKKFSILSAFDASSIPQEKEAATKDKILEERLKRKAKIFYNKLAPFFKLIANFSQRKIKSAHDKLKEIEERYKTKAKREALVTKEEFENLEGRLAAFNREAETLIEQGEYEKAEKEYLEMLNFDSRNIEAYRGLGNLYLKQKNYLEAKQTFLHALKLIKLEGQSVSKLNDGENLSKEKEGILQTLNLKNAAINFELAEVSYKMEAYNDTADYLNQALEIEPNNPKYLDLLITISIIKKDREMAHQVLLRLKEVNPENNKIAEFEEKIKEL